MTRSEVEAILEAHRDGIRLAGREQPWQRQTIQLCESWLERMRAMLSWCVPMIVGQRCAFACREASNESKSPSGHDRRNR